MLIWSEMSYIKYSKLPAVCQEENSQDYIDYINYDIDNEFFDEDISNEFNSFYTDEIAAKYEKVCDLYGNSEFCI